MILTFVRTSICLVLSLALFIACNQSRHVLSDKNIQSDKEYVKLRKTKIEKLNSLAGKLVGMPYRLGSSGPKSFDCSGFTSYVFNTINITLPRKASDQAHLGHGINPENIQPGDLVFFGSKRIDHVALVTNVKRGQITIIHSASSVGVSKLVIQQSDYWMKRLKFGRRVII
jgi:cell wall-associated NlpC family hydrolase